MSYRPPPSKPPDFAQEYLVLDGTEADREERLAIILEGSTRGVVTNISQKAAERLADECVAQYPAVAKAMVWRP